MQVPGEDFFLRTIPLFDGGKDVGMVLSPQCFHNLNGDADVFNHGNVCQRSQRLIDSCGGEQCKAVLSLLNVKIAHL